jgi:hypothetical protein
LVSVEASVSVRVCLPISSLRITVLMTTLICNMLANRPHAVKLRWLLVCDLKARAAAV